MMEDWVHRAMAKWPNVPALYGWLRLDRRGRWLIRGESISRPQIIDTLNANYAADERGCWYFQNGPQRGYVALDYAPLVLRVDGDGGLRTHSGLAVEQPRAAWLDEHGSLLLSTEHGPGLLDDQDLDWALAHLRVEDRPVTEAELEHALAQDSGSDTDLRLNLSGHRIPVCRLDMEAAPERLGFVREPEAG
jgi:hypothetical protein